MTGVLNCTHLKSLDLASNTLKCRAAGVIGQALRSSECKLLALDLTNNFIENKGMNELHVGLVSNRRLVELRVGMNVGIPHAKILRIKATIDRNRQMAQSQRFPKLIMEKHFLKKNSMSWRAEFSQLEDKITDALE